MLYLDKTYESKHVNIFKRRTKEIINDISKRHF
jgi:hypothetical protein